MEVEVFFFFFLVFMHLNNGEIKSKFFFFLKDFRILSSVVSSIIMKVEGFFSDYLCI